MRVLRLSGSVLLISACSLVNSFDEVGAIKEPAGGAAGSSAGTDVGGTAQNEGGMAGEGGAPAGGAGTSGSGGSNAGTENNGGTGGTDTPGMGGMGGEGPDAGMLLIGASIVTGGPVSYAVIAMSPEGGVELSREDSNRVLGIVYDSTSAVPDNWLVFLANDTGSPLDPAILSVRHYDESDGSFHEIGSLEVPPPVTPDAIVILNNRVFYRSVVAGAPPKYGFTLVDISKPRSPELLGMAQAPDLPNLIGMLGHPSTAAAGGAVTLITQNNDDCVADALGAVGDKTCPVKARRGTLSGGTAMTIDPDNKAVAVGDIAFRGGVYALAGWTSGNVGSGPRDVFVFPPIDYTQDTKADVSIRVPATFGEDKTFKVDIAGRRIPSVAYDPCRQIVLATETTDARALFAITAANAGAGTISQALGHPGSRVLYDQYSRTAFTTFEDASNPSIDAWTLNGTDVAPTFKARLRSGARKWAPESDVNPSIIAIKTPVDPLCE
jgi:hypothetical protein